MEWKAVAIVIGAGLVVFVLQALRSASSNVLTERLEGHLGTWFGSHGLKVHVEADPRRMNLDRDLRYAHSFIFENDRDLGSPPVDDLAWRDWAHRHRGADAYLTRIVVTVQATMERTVVVDEPILTIVSSSVTRGFLRGPVGTGGNGGLIPRMFEFDLDRPETRPEYFDLSGGDRPPVFKLAKGDTERLDLIVVAHSNMRHLWRIELPLIVNGTRRTIKIPSSRTRPFETCGAEGLPGTWWREDESRWDPRAYG